MAEPRSETEDETMNSTMLKEIKARMTKSEIMMLESDGQISTDYKSTKYESETDEGSRMKNPLVGERADKIDRLMNLHEASRRSAKSQSNPSQSNPWQSNPSQSNPSQSNSKEKNEQKTATFDVVRVLNAEAVNRSFPLHEYFPLGGFQLERRARTTAVGLDRRRRPRIWRSLRMRQPTGKGTLAIKRFQKVARMSRDRNESLWPTSMRDVAIELERRERRTRLPDDFLELQDVDEKRIDFATRKELGHAHVPVWIPDFRKKLLVDRAVGDHSGLVDGDYVMVELPSHRTYAYAVLHGLKGMHLQEITTLRERMNTWKFCFYQAIVALLAKTQFRYKYLSSVNIDYIYNHAWMLFTHIGAINVMSKHRLDDVVVFNYKFSVEIELIDKLEDIPVHFVDKEIKESGLRKKITLDRQDPLKTKIRFGRETLADFGHVSLHEKMEKLEYCLGEFITQYPHGIMRTPRFSLAFWQDGPFWYIYNPYRCDSDGFWDYFGHACIVKLCSADALRRHLIILLLRGYAYEELHSRYDNIYDIDLMGEKYYLAVQFFHVIFHDCQLDNPKMLQRGLPKQPRRDDDDDRPLDSLDPEDWEDETDRKEDEDGESKKPRERIAWLRRCPATWGKYTPAGKPDSAEVTAVAKARWHQYYVEEPNRLFSLWGEIHPTDSTFDEANRGMQLYACYVVCAGMTRITAPEYWSPNTLDAIVVCGDRYYARSKRELESVSDYVGAYRPFKYLCGRFEIGEILFEARMLPAVRGRLYARSSECLWRTLERVFSGYHFAVLTCESACLGLYKFCGAYYMCDANSFGPPLFPYGHGVAYLLRATSFRKFVTVLVLTVGSSERSPFSLNPIEILRIVEMNAALKSCAKTRERKGRFGKLVEKTPRKFPRFRRTKEKNEK